MAERPGGVVRACAYHHGSVESKGQTRPRKHPNRNQVHEGFRRFERARRENGRYEAGITVLHEAPHGGSVGHPANHRRTRVYSVDRYLSQR